MPGKKDVTGLPKDTLTPGISSPSSAQSPPETSIDVQFENPALGQRLLNWMGSLGRGRFAAELGQINQLEPKVQKLKTPADFQAQTAAFKQRLASGESLESLRVEAYAVARRAAEVASGMRPYDCQVMGALAMADGQIAEMMTGEGKTLTAVMPLYLNALAGKGAHLVTVNDRLAERDRDDMGPIFELLGMKAGAVLESMTPEQKREGYACDVTYTTDRTLGFDYLRDRLARRSEDRVQRAPFFALVDEVDQVLLDEARTPLIISGPAQPASQDYQVFQDIVEELEQGVEYFVDREKGAAWLTDIGTDFVQNELYKRELSFKDAGEVAEYHRKRAAIRAEGNAWEALRDHRAEKPGLWGRIKDSSWGKAEEALEQKYEEAAARSEALGDHYHLYAEENLHRVRALNASLKANVLFEEGVNYLVQDQRVKSVDENKGRTSKGRRFNEGLHQALEAKSGVPMRPESRPVASITYPNLFAKYERLAGMSGTARSSEHEFVELYDLDVMQVPTNLQFQLKPEDPTKARRHNRIDHTDVVLATKKEKFEAVVAEAVKASEEGVPVMVGTLSVEANEYVYAKLLEQGVPRGAVQLLNAETVRGDKTRENSIIAQAGRSGLITVATNMAGRGVHISPDKVNYKQLALKVEPLVVDVSSEQEAERLAQWLEGAYPYRIGEGSPGAGETLIRVNSEDPVPDSAQGLNSSQFPTGGLYVIGTERAKSRRIDDQLIGRSGRQGQPGQSRFFLSLQDDLFREFGGSALTPKLNKLSAQGGQVESDDVARLVARAQSHVGAEHFHAREDTTDYDKVLNKQRETFYGIRDSILESEADLRSKLIQDTLDVVESELDGLLPGRRQEPGKVRQALAQVAQKYGLDLSWTTSEKTKTRRVLESVSGQVKAQLEGAMGKLDGANIPLDEPYRQTLLNVHDEAWTAHLEDMERLKRGVRWVAFAEKDPAIEYSFRGFDAFESMLDGVKQVSVEAIVPQLMTLNRMGARQGTDKAAP